MACNGKVVSSNQTVKSWREIFFLLSVCPDREETIWCFSALHGLGQTLWFSAVSEWPQWQLRRLEGNLYWQQQCCKSASTVGGRVLKGSLLFFTVLCECSWIISCSTLLDIWWSKKAVKASASILVVFMSRAPLFGLQCSVFWLQAAVSMLKQDYKEGEMSLSSALALAVKVLNKTMDVSKLSAEKGGAQADIVVM